MALLASPGCHQWNIRVRSLATEARRVARGHPSHPHILSWFCGFSGADPRTRTGDLLFTKLSKDSPPTSDGVQVSHGYANSVEMPSAAVHRCPWSLGYPLGYAMVRGGVADTAFARRFSQRQ